MTWRNRQGAAAAVIIALALVWRAVLLAGSYFNQDDFYLSGRAYSSDLDLEFLTRATAGHVNPMQQLTYWVVARAAPYDWPVVATFIVAMHLAAAVLMWHVLSRILPGRRVRLVLLVVFVCSPLTLATSLWWSAAMGLWPHITFSLWSILFLLRADQGAGRRWVNLLGCVVMVVMGLLWHERSVLIVPTLFGVAVVLADDRRGWRRVTAALRTWWPLWVGSVAALGAFLAWHAAITSVTGGGTNAKEALRISWSFVGENVVPGLLAGPWSADLRGGAVLPSAWVTVVACAAAVGLTVLLVRRGGPSAPWAIAGLAGYVLADLALVLAGRGGFGRIIGLDPRYSSDVVHAAVVVVALALRDSPRHFGLRVDETRWRRLRWRGVVGVSVLYLVGASFATARLVPHFQNTEDRAYVTNFRDTLAADPNQVVSDALAPADVVLPLVGDDSRLSRIFAPLRESPAFDLPSPRFRVADEDGRLRPVVLLGAIPGREGPVENCGYPVRSADTDVELFTEIATPMVLHFGYFTDTETTVEVTAGSYRTQFQAKPGPNEVWIPVPTPGEQIDAASLSTIDGTVVCVTEMQAGLPVPPAG